MKFKAIIFDMDGTIIDSEKLWHQATLDLLSHYNIPINDTILQDVAQQIIGQSFTSCCEVIQKVGNIDDELTAIMEKKLTIVSALFEKNLNFIDGFVPFHEKSKQYNLKTAIATNAPNHILDLSKKILNLEQFFSHHTYGVDHVQGKAKPDPAVYHHAAEQLEIPTNYCIAIEDSIAGITAAKKAGIFCIGINTSKNPHHVKDADLQVNHYDEILLEQILGLIE